jgi:hemoglobin-like flavoprotein
MEMTPRQMQCVRNSWRNFRDLDPAFFSEPFYAKLFADHPAAKKVFGDNLAEHFSFLHEMLSQLVSRIDRPDQLLITCSRIARNNAALGMNGKFYEWYGHALIWTLRQGAGADWNMETEQSWISYYKYLVDQIQILQHGIAEAIDH